MKLEEYDQLNYSCSAFPRNQKIHININPLLYLLKYAISISVHYDIWVIFSIYTHPHNLVLGDKRNPKHNCIPTKGFKTFDRKSFQFRCTIMCGLNQLCEI